LPDSQPNYLTTNADGSVGALFPGGVQLNAHGGPGGSGGIISFPPNPAKSVSWQQEGDAFIAGVTAYAVDAPGPTSRAILRMSAERDPWASEATIFMQNNPPGGGSIDIFARGSVAGLDEARLILDASDGFSEIRAEIDGFTPTRRILDTFARSDFVQTMSESGASLHSKLALQVVSSSWVWPGGTGQRIAAINHSLGRTPLLVIAQNTQNNTPTAGRTYSYTTTQFTLDVFHTSGGLVGAGISDTYTCLVVG
jgi:hypothetical protein